MPKNSSRSHSGTDGRLFELPPVSGDLKHSRVIDELLAIQENPSSALRIAACICIREYQTAQVESQVKKLAQGFYGEIAEHERTANDLAHLATLSYDNGLYVEAFEALDKSRITLLEVADPKSSDVTALYSSCVLLTQAFPAVENMEIIANIALLRASTLTGGIVNAFEVLLNLSIELHSDDGAIAQPKFYESLFSTFKGISSDLPWIEPNKLEPYSPKDFACLVRTTVRGKDVSNVSTLSADQPRQLVLELMYSTPN